MSFYNSGSGVSNANTGPGAQYNNNAAGPQYNYNYYGSPPSGSAQERERLEREKQECLRSLSFSNIDARRQDIALVHPNTGDWIFQTREFRRWRDRTNLAEHNGVLWIKGHPGTGKSTLMKHIWGHCLRELQDRTIATYFFHARGESLEKTPLGMLRSLVCQLIDKEEPTYQRFLPIFCQKNRPHEKLEWREPELKDFLLSEMQVRQRPPLVILIDALDECSDSQVRNVVKFLKQLSIACLRSGASVWICLSSRHYPHITMAKYQELVVETRTGHDTDIATYVHDNLTTSNPDIEKEVLKKASGIFMWVVLVVEMLNRAYDEGKIKAMEQKLREVPSDLDELFSTILSKENPDKQETILMLQWVLFAVQPLRPEDLYYATLAGTGVTNLGPGDQSQLTADDIQRYITYSTKGLIEVPKAESTVQFIHESVKDFLLRNQRLQSLDPTLGSNPIGQSHDRLKTCCLSFIETNASILDDISMNGDSIKRDEFHLKYPFLKYASLHWLDHAEAAEAGNVSQVEYLRGMKEDHGVERLSLAHTLFCPGYCIKDADLLYISLVHAHNRLAKIILEYGADISPQGWNYDCALHASAVTGSKEMVRLLIEYGADPNHWHVWETSLHAATRYGHGEAVRVLLEHGADVNALNADSEFALSLALHSDAIDTVSERKDVMKLLLEHGAGVHVKHGKNAATILHDTIFEGYEEIVRLLLEHGADVNAIGGAYGTALHTAAAPAYYFEGRDPRWAITKMLLDYGADVNAQVGKYGTALQVAVPSGKKDVVMLLLEYGADINARGGLHNTALQAAAVHIPLRHFMDGGFDWTDMIKMLLDNGADVNAQGGVYGTALKAAASYPAYHLDDRGTGLRSIIKILLDYGADVNAQDGRNGTALQAAILRGNKDMAMFLLEHDADVNAQGGKYGTALQAAISTGNKDIEMLLRDYGATE